MRHAKSPARLDTSLKIRIKPEIERVLVALIRATPSQKRFHLVQSLSLGFPPTNNRIHLSEREDLLHYCTRSYGTQLAACGQEALGKQESWCLQPSDLMSAMLPVVQTLERFGLRPSIGGSW